MYHVFPSNGGTLQSSGEATGHNIYIGQDNSKYYACASVSGHEVCLSQPYTQYGLSGHTLNTNFTQAQQESAMQAIYQAFIDAGISVDINTDCGSGSAYATCGVGNIGCEVMTDHIVRCGNSEYEFCTVDNAGGAFCIQEE